MNRKHFFSFLCIVSHFVQKVPRRKLKFKMASLTLMQAVFLFTSQLLITVFVIISQMTARTIILYSQFYHYDSDQLASMCIDPEYRHFFGIWTSREYYTQGVANGMKNELNSFDHRIRSVRAFITMSIITAMLLLVFTTDRLCRRFAGPNRSPEGEDWCKWIHIFLCGFQFYCIFASTWCFSSLIHTCSVPWTFIIMCSNVSVSGILACFVVTCEINLPEQDEETGSIVRKTKTLFIVAGAFFLATVVLSFGSIAQFSTSDSESNSAGDETPSESSLMLLLNSFAQTGFKTAALTTFIANGLLTLIVILLLILLMILKNPAPLQLVLFLTMELVYLNYALGLICLCLLSRAPAFLDPNIRNSLKAISFYLEITKFIFSNVATWLVVLGVVNRDDILQKFRPAKDYQGSVASDESLFQKLRNARDKKMEQWEENARKPLVDGGTSTNTSGQGNEAKKKKVGESRASSQSSDIKLGQN